MDIKETLTIAHQFLQHLWRRFNADGCRQSAAALTYMSLFAVVPLMTLMYSMFSLVPAFQGLGDQVRNLIFQNFVPQSGAEIQQYLVEFSGQARKLSAAGAAILVVTSYLMLTNVERNFNAIWGTTGGRKGLSSFLLYWGVLSLGPLLLGAGLMMRTYLVSFQLIVDEVDTLGVTGWIFEYIPFLLTWVVFSLLFIAVPNCRVNTRYAIIGGLVTTLFFELAKNVFGAAISNTSYANVYGAFAVVPIFLIWLYVGWTIILAGAELVRSLETFKTARWGNRYPDLVAMLIIIWECWQRQSRGLETSDRDMVRIGLDDEHWRRLRDKLLDHKYMAVTVGGRYVITRAPKDISLWQLNQLAGPTLAALPNNSGADLTGYSWYPVLADRMQTLDDSARETLSPTLQQLFAEESSNN